MSSFLAKLGITSNNKPQNRQNQLIQFENVSIKCKKNKRVLDVCQDEITKGMLIIYEDYDQPNQRFNITRSNITPGKVHIINNKNGKYLTVGSSSVKDGAPIFQQPILGFKGQQFMFQRDFTENQQIYYIHTFVDGKVLDLCQQKLQNGTRVIQYENQRKDTQKWLIIRK